jgi:hypothetical protein
VSLPTTPAQFSADHDEEEETRLQRLLRLEEDFLMQLAMLSSPVSNSQSSSASPAALAVPPGPPPMACASGASVTVSAPSLLCLLRLMHTFFTSHLPQQARTLPVLLLLRLTRPLLRRPATLPHPRPFVLPTTRSLQQRPRRHDSCRRICGCMVASAGPRYSPTPFPPLTHGVVPRSKHMLSTWCRFAQEVPSQVFSHCCGTT